LGRRRLGGRGKALRMTGERAVVDANVLVAMIDSKDKWHGKAGRLLEALEAEDLLAAYLDCVFNETVSVMARRAEEQKRSRELPGLLKALFEKIPLEKITRISLEVPRMFSQVIGLVEESGGVLNFNDSLMALFCREADIGVVVSFDKDFDEIPWLTRISLPESLKAVFDRQ